MHNYKLIIDFFGQYTDHYIELLDFENKKLKYIISSDVNQLSSCLGKEQALIMKGNNLEAKRIDILKKEGLGETSFGEMIQSAPDEYKDKLQSVFSGLSKYVLEVKRINDEAMNVVRVKLNSIENKMSHNSGEIYNDKGGRNHTAMSVSMTKNV